MICRAVLLLLTGLSLAACSWMGDLFGSTDDLETLNARLAARPSVYCYRTLAIADCYAEPRSGQTHRLLGYEAALPPPPR